MAIEKNIPIPSFCRGNGYVSKWDAFEVGDSELFSKSQSASVASYCKTKKDKKFTQRAVEGGYRVWRIK